MLVAHSYENCQVLKSEIQYLIKTFQKSQNRELPLDALLIYQKCIMSRMT